MFRAIALFCFLVRALPFLLLAWLPAAQAGARLDHWSGFDVGVGQPFPSFVGGMVGFNLGDDARISGGGGWFQRWDTATVDAKVFLMDTPLAPYIGGGISYIFGSAGNILLWDFNFDQGYFPYIEGGIDYTAPSEGVAFHFTANIAVSTANYQVLLLPGIAIGCYF